MREEGVEENGRNMTAQQVLKLLTFSISEANLLARASFLLNSSVSVLSSGVL